MGEEHDPKSARGEDAPQSGAKDRVRRNPEAEADGPEVEGHRMVRNPTERAADKTERAM